VLLGLRPGSILRIEAARWVVERCLRFEQGSERWSEYRLSSDESGRSLSLEVHPGEPPTLIVYAPGRPVESPPGADRIDHDGGRYERLAGGDATYRSEERAGPPKSGTLSYVEYADGDERLAFERYEPPAGWTVSRGRVVAASELDVVSP
jgi:hypothetical protein